MDSTEKIPASFFFICMCLLVMIFTPNQLLPPHADPTFLVQFAVIYNFSARGILVRCVPEVIQKFPI